MSKYVGLEGEEKMDGICWWGGDKNSGWLQKCQKKE